MATDDPSLYVMSSWAELDRLKMRYDDLLYASLLRGSILVIGVPRGGAELHHDSGSSGFMNFIGILHIGIWYGRYLTSLPESLLGWTPSLDR